MKKIISIAILISFLLLPACKESSSPTSPEVSNDLTPSNRRPIMESLTGPSSCKLGQTYTYKVKGYDPDGEKVAFHFNIYKGDWIPVDNLGWGSYVNNHEEYIKSITWSYGTGEFIICAHCKDEQGLQTLQQGHYTLYVYVTE